MYECPNCGSNLKFDIASQQLRCEHCQTLVDPYDVPEETDTEEIVISAEEAGVKATGEKKYLVTVFTCPQCGGEIISEDNTAATFCSFCGSAAILDSRISRERRPGYIIPFTQTKEDCEVAYRKMMKRAIFAPKELKDKGHIEKFRGIYMPYWVYSFEKKGPVTFQGTKNYRIGNYRCTKYYDLSCEIDEKYEGIAYDASASFSDNLSGAIAPFDLEKGKPFTPAFLSGFYGDTSDVEKHVYQEDAQNMVVADGCDQISKKFVCRRHNVGKGGNISTVKNAVRPSKDTAQLAMIPVWFLSYRNGDRVSYAVVNGQTGKAAADIPVDPKRYLIGSAILAVPLFFLLNLFLTITPVKILGIAMLLALVSIIISNSQMSEILARESGEDDKGLMWYRRNKRLDRRPSEEKQKLADAMADKREKRKANQHLWNRVARPVLKLLFIPFYMVFTMLCMYGLLKVTAGVLDNTVHSGGQVAMLAVLWIVSMAAIGLLPVFAMGKAGVGRIGFFFKNLKTKLPALGKPLAGILLSLVILLLNPVEDMFYYIGALICMGTVLWSIIDIIRQHNQLSTRKLPQFNRRGGDENA